MTAPDRSSDRASSDTDTIIHRKVEASRAQHLARAMTLPKALRLSVARVADEVLDLPLAALSVGVESVERDDLEQSLPEAGLLMLLEGPAHRRGAAIFDTALAGGIVQQLTTGKVRAQDSDDDRPMTVTDSAVCAPFLDAFLARAATLPESPEDRALLEGFGFGARVEDRRVLVMVLEEQSYRVMRMSLDMAGGKRQGTMLLCLPVAEISETADMSADAEGTAEDAAEVVDRHVPSSMAETVQNLSADLRICLAQIRMPLGRLGELSAGETLDIGVPDFDRVRVETKTGALLSRGTLGQIEGVRAVHVQAGGKRPSKSAEGASGAAFPSPDGLPDRVAQNRAVEPGSDDGAAGLPDLPLPDVPVEDALPDLPDMSDLPDLDDMPDFGEPMELPETKAG